MAEEVEIVKDSMTCFACAWSVQKVVKECQFLVYWINLSPWKL